MIACENIVFQHPSAETALFDRLTWTIDQPGFHALFGPSGVGKTTLAKIIAGDIDGFEGKVSITGDGPCLYTYNQERLPGWSSVGRHLAKTTPKEKKSLKNDLVQAFGLSGILEKRFSQLSMGQCNRVNLLRYLLQSFGLLIMDESLANVDEPTRQSILYTIKSIFPTVSFLYISHNVVEVARFCDRIVVLRGGDNASGARIVVGQNHRRNQPLNTKAIEAAMLEIINAA